MKIIQITAGPTGLLGLGDDGEVYLFNTSNKTWVNIKE